MSEIVKKILVGQHAVSSALSKQNNILEEILITSKALDKYSDMLKDISHRKIKVVEKNILDSKTKQPHQGIIATFKVQEHKMSFAEILKHSNMVVLLDQITDPHNVGAIVRSANAFGATAVITTSKNSATDSPIIAKASSGAIEDTPIITITNLSTAIKQLQDEGFWVVGLDGYAQGNLDSVDLKGKIAFVMGSEGKGMRDLVKKNCDILAKLPMTGSVESLNVSVACGVTLYEYAKQNTQK